METTVKTKIVKFAMATNLAYSQRQPLPIGLLGKVIFPKNLSSLTTHYRFANFTIDRQHDTLYQDRNKMTITSDLIDLLLVFVRHPYKVLNREVLFNLMHNKYAVPYNHTIDIKIAQLRRLLNDKKNIFIKNFQDQGYYFACEVMHG